MGSFLVSISVGVGKLLGGISEEEEEVPEEEDISFPSLMILITGAKLI